MTRDRMPSGDFLLAHEFLGMMLGVWRTTVTDVMGGLQRAGLIHYRRVMSRSSITRICTSGPANATTFTSAHSTGCLAIHPPRRGPARSTD
jgi:hypothetical protein